MITFFQSLLIEILTIFGIEVDIPDQPIIWYPPASKKCNHPWDWISIWTSKGCDHVYCDKCGSNLDMRAIK